MSGGRLLLGRLGKTFQLVGALRFRPESDAALAALEELDAVFVSGVGRLRVRGLEHTRSGTLVYLEGVRDRTAAQTLVNAEVHADADQLPDELAAALRAGDEASRLEGMRVSLGSEVIGVVKAAHFGPNDYVEIDLASGGIALIPLNAPYVESSGDGIRLVDPPAGLLEP